MVKAKEKSATVWLRKDEATLIQVLKQQKALGNWGDNNPKKIAWTACELALAGSEAKSGGGRKTVVVIKNRWQHVRSLIPWTHGSS
jgi:hypothetical protein